MTGNKVFEAAAIVSAFAVGGCYAGAEYHERGVTYHADVAVEPAPAVVEAPPAEVVSTFDAELAPYGQWVVVGGYGRCWRPAGVSATWRPYTVGNWVYTDAGWAWASDEPWGDATYHYGRWFEDPQSGWVWVPGSVWAPAWVAWRSGGGYVGWAPLGPEIGFGVTISEYETRRIPPSHFCFVEERAITERHVHDRIVNVQQNTTIINKTTNITHITTVNKKVVNSSLKVEEVERATGHKVERAQVKEVKSAAEAKQAREKGEAVAWRPATLERAADAEHAKAASAERAKPAPKVEENAHEADRTKAAEVKKAEAARERQTEERRQETERARAAEAKKADAAKERQAEERRQEAERARAAEAKKADAAKERQAEERRQETERAKEAEKAKDTERAREAAERERKAKEAEKDKRENPR